MSGAAVTVTLPFLPPPQHGESFSGYLSRLAYQNLYPNVFWIPAMFGVPGSHISIPRAWELLDVMSRQMGTPLKLLQQTSYEPSGIANNRKVVIAGSGLLDVKLLHLMDAKVCPQCLSEFGSVLKVWDLRALLCCPRHKRKLLNKCPECESKISRWRPTPFFCHACGFDLRKAKVLPSRGVDVQLARLFAAKFPLPYRCNTGEVHHSWQNLPLEMLLANIQLLYKYHPERKRRANPHSYSDWSEVLALCGDCIIDWPYSFWSYLALLIKFNKISNPEGQGVKSTFGRFYDVVANEDNCGNYRLIKDFLVEYVNNNPDEALVTGRGNCMVHREGRQSRYYLTRTEAQQALGVSADHCRSLLKEGFLQGFEVQVGGQTIHRISRHSVELLCKEKTSSLDFEAAAAQLRITRTVLKHLISMEIVTLVKPYENMGRARSRISAYSVSSLQYKIAQLKLRPINLQKDAFVSFSEAYRLAAKLPNTSGEKFLKKMLDGTIRPRFVAEDELGFSKLKFLTLDIFNVFGVQTISSSCANSIFGCFLGDRRNEGLRDILQPTRHLGECRRVYSPNRIVWFLENYISLSQAKNEGQSFRLDGLKFEVPDTDLVAGQDEERTFIRMSLLDRLSIGEMNGR